MSLVKQLSSARLLLNDQEGVFQRFCFFFLFKKFGVQMTKKVSICLEAYFEVR